MFHQIKWSIIISNYIFLRPVLINFDEVCCNPFISFFVELLRRPWAWQRPSSCSPRRRRHPPTSFSWKSSSRSFSEKTPGAAPDSPTRSKATATVTTDRRLFRFPATRLPPTASRHQRPIIPRRTRAATDTADTTVTAGVSGFKQDSTRVGAWTATLTVPRLFPRPPLCRPLVATEVRKGILFKSISVFLAFFQVCLFHTHHQHWPGAWFIESSHRQHHQHQNQTQEFYKRINRWHRSATDWYIKSQPLSLPPYKYMIHIHTYSLLHTYILLFHVRELTNIQDMLPNEVYQTL